MSRRTFCLSSLIALLSAYPLFAQAPVAPLPAKTPADSPDGPPVVTAKAWAVADGKTGKLLWGSHESDPLTMASTTKIMTARLVLALAAKDPKALDEIVTVSERAAKTGGSSAKIKAGE